MKQISSRPTQKVISGAVAGALSAILVYILNTFVLTNGQSIPAEIASALTTLLTLLVSYMVPPGAGDGIASVQGAR